MSEEYKLHQHSQRADAAQTLLESPVLAEAFSALEAAYLGAWRSTTIDDVAGREKLFLAINVIGKVKHHLSLVVDGGKLAQAELRALAQTAERQKTWAEVRH